MGRRVVDEIHTLVAEPVLLAILDQPRISGLGSFFSLSHLAHLGHLRALIPSCPLPSILSDSNLTHTSI